MLGNFTTEGFLLQQTVKFVYDYSVSNNLNFVYLTFIIFF